MADARFCVGFSSACKQAREGGGLPGCAPEYRGVSADGCLVFYPRRLWLPPDIVRLIDALVRRLEHEDTLVSMSGGGLGRTLCEAAAAGGLRDVRFLLARGAEVEFRTFYVNGAGDVESDFTALEWSARHGHLAVATALLDAGAVERDAALHTAAFYGHTPVVALLLDRGADVSFDDGEPLIVSAQNGHLATATLLLDRGADVNAQNGSPLLVAAQNGRLKMVTLLLDRGADLHADADRALRAAADRGQVEVVRLLLDRGANIHAGNDYALRAARREGHTAVVVLLLERSALEPQA